MENRMISLERNTNDDQRYQAGKLHTFGMDQRNSREKC